MHADCFLAVVWVNFCLSMVYPGLLLLNVEHTTTLGSEKKTWKSSLLLTTGALSDAARERSVLPTSGLSLRSRPRHETDETRRIKLLNTNPDPDSELHCLAGLILI